LNKNIFWGDDPIYKRYKKFKKNIKSTLADKRKSKTFGALGTIMTHNIGMTSTEYPMRMTQYEERSQMSQMS
jgi:hypothetical protein